MPKVLHCLSNLDLGGVEKRVLRQLPILQAEGSFHHGLISFRGGVLAEKAQEELSRAGVSVHILNKGPALDLAFNRRFIEKVKQFKPDLVVAYNFVAAFWTRILLRGRFHGIVVHEGGIRNAGTWWGRFSETILEPWTRARIFNSTSTALVWRHSIGQHPSEFIVLNGVDTPSSFTPQKKGDRPFTLISVGRLAPVKGIEIQLRALAIFKKNVPNVMLLVVGSGPEKEKLQHLATELGVNDAVQWLGYRDETNPLYQQSDVFLCTSYNETFSLTLCEAMSNNLACIAPQIGGPAEILRHNKDGLLVPCHQTLSPEVLKKLPALVADPETGYVGIPRGIAPGELAEALLKLHSSPSLRIQMGRHAGARVKSDFSLEKYCSRLVQVYSNVLKEDIQP